MRDTPTESHAASGLPGEHKARAQASLHLRERGQNWLQQVMKLFFTDGTSLATQKIADLQRRACWVGIAVILQFFHETLRVAIQAIEVRYTSTVTLLDPTSNIILIALIVGSFLALWMAWTGASPNAVYLKVVRLKGVRLKVRGRRPQGSRRRKAVVYTTESGCSSVDDCRDDRLRSSASLAPLWSTSSWQLWVCRVCLILALVGGGAGIVSIVHCFLPMQFANDGTVLDTNAAVTLLHGDDPYANPNLGNLNLMQDVSVHAEWTTPLREGRFAGRLEYPTNDELEAALLSGLKTAHAQEFETKVSYPTLSFISLIPFALFNHFNVLPLYILCHLLLIVVAWKYARPELRPWILLLAFANVSLWTTTVGETLDMLYISLLTLAWLTSHRRGFSIILLGLAIASKQTAWFFVPFYAIMVYWQYGFKESLGRVVAAFSIGLAINLPFILWGPSDWLAGVMAPLVDPMFPMGTGLIALSTGHVISFLPTGVYQVVEYTAYGLSLIYYWFRCRQAPEAAMLLAVLFLFFAWRSLPSYFYCSAFPLLVLMLKKPIPGQTDPTRQGRTSPVFYPQL